MPVRKREVKKEGMRKRVDKSPHSHSSRLGKWAPEKLALYRALPMASAFPVRFYTRMYSTISIYFNILSRTQPSFPLYS